MIESSNNSIHLDTLLFASGCEDWADQLVTIRDATVARSRSDILLGSISLKVCGEELLGRPISGDVGVMWLTLLECGESVDLGRTFSSDIADNESYRLECGPVGSGAFALRVRGPGVNRDARMSGSRFVEEIRRSGTEFTKNWGRLSRVAPSTVSLYLKWFERMRIDRFGR